MSRDQLDLREIIEELDDRSLDDLKEGRSVGVYVGDLRDAPDDCETHIIVTRGEMRQLRKLVAALPPLRETREDETTNDVDAPANDLPSGNDGISAKSVAGKAPCN
jgi:hypothetical protein